MNISKYKKDFSVFQRQINGKKLVYLDNAATSQIPYHVLNAISDFDQNHRANVHRGVHTLSIEASEMYEEARKTVAEFVGAVVPEEIIFTKNTTESLNLVADSLGNLVIKNGDIILISEVEHHSNLVPWQIMAEKKKAVINFIKIDEEGFIDLKSTCTDWNKVRLVCFNHVSNVTGAIQDIKAIVKDIKIKYGKGESPYFVLDGAQSVPHMPVNVQSLGIDFMAFSGHKMCGPFGIGVLWGKRELLEKMSPYIYGGGMIRNVTYQESDFKSYPEKFEAGTPNISGAVGLGAACRYLKHIGLKNIHDYESEITSYALKTLASVNEIVVYGPKTVENRAGIISFNVKEIPAHDVAAVLDTEGVAVRSGHHCVMPWHLKQEITTSVRASLYFYNDESDIDAFLIGINKAISIFK